MAPENSGTHIVTLDGIMADQWPDSAITRVFKLTFTQSNGYTLSQQVPVSIYSYPSGLSVCLFVHLSANQSQSDIIIIELLVV